MVAVVFASERRICEFNSRKMAWKMTISPLKRLYAWGYQVISYNYKHFSARFEKIFVKPAAPAPVGPYLIYDAKYRPFVTYGTYDDNPEIETSFKRYSLYEQSEYVCNIHHTTFIEPLYGFVVTGGHTYYRESVPYCDDEATPHPCTVHDGSKICLDEAISLRYGWNNYWHFLNDSISTLLFLHAHGVSKDIPIVIPEKALQYQYVCEVLKNHEYFRKLNFIFQSSRQWIECKKIWFGKALPNTKSNLVRVCSSIDVNNSYGLKDKKIFITRRGNNKRQLSNIDVIEYIAETSGFYVVDTADLDVAAQKAMFESVNVVVGVHGAGLSNLIFAHGNVTKVLEIFPENFIPPHYYWLSKELGYDYKAILGSCLNGTSEFTLNEVLFSDEINKL